MKNKLHSLATRLENTILAAGISVRFSRDLMANVISFGWMAVVGILLNLLIAARYSTEILGIYNQVYAIYLFLSQLAVGGVHLSILKHLAEKDHNPEEERKVFSPGFGLTLVTALGVSAIAFWGRNTAAGLLQSPGVETGIAFSTPGLLFFSLNKVMLSLLNAQRRMVAFAMGQAVRAGLMLISALVLFKVDSSGLMLPGLFSVSEFLLFLGLLSFVRRSLSIRAMAGRLWLHKHLNFGLSAMLGNLLMNTYNKFDVIILGIFASDPVVGVYSLAAMLLDGYLQLGVVFRNNVNPVLAKKFIELSRAAFEQLCKRVRNYSFVLLGAVGAAAVTAFPLLGVFFPGVDLREAWVMFGILMAGAVVSQVYMPLSMVLNQCGKPGLQSVQIGLVFLTIVILNFILVPWMGISGAAIATSLTYLLQAFYLKLFTAKALGVRI